MSERAIYDNKYSNNLIKQQQMLNNHLKNSSKLLDNPQIAQYANKFIMDPNIHQKTQNQRKINFNMALKNEYKIPSVSQQNMQQTDSYQIQQVIQNIGHGGSGSVGSALRRNELINLYSNTACNDSSKTKKVRRLRKNFDVLQQALKNSSHKKEKKQQYSSETRTQHNTSQFVPIQKRGNYIENSPGSASKLKSDSVHEMFQYGGVSHNVSQLLQNNTQQLNMKDRKSSCYDVLGTNYGTNFQHAQNSTQNMSLYSQISLKENSTTPNKKKIMNSRNQVIYQNLPQHNTQPMIMIGSNNLGNDQRSFMRVNDKMMGKYAANTSNDIKSNMRAGEEQNRSNSHAILNISTASDINIYNNSFIVNTGNMGAKKAPQSQNQSRSSSVKRNQNYQQQLVQATSALGMHQTKNSKIIGIQHQQVRAASSQGRNNSLGGKFSYTQNNNSIKETQKIQQLNDAYIHKQTNPVFQQNQLVSNTMRQQILNNIVQSGTSQRSIQNSRNSFELVGAVNSESNIRKIKNLEQMLSQSQKRCKMQAWAGSNRSTKRTNEMNISRNNIEEQTQIEQLNDNKIQKSMNMTKQAKQKLLTRDYQQAIQIFTDAIAIDESNYEAKFYRAISLLDSGQLKESIQELNDVIKNSKQHEQLSYILLSIAYKRSNNLQKVTKVLSECIQKFQNYPDAYLARGQSYLLQEKFDQALKDFTMHTQLIPNQPIGHIGIGDSLKSMKKWNEAIQAYSNAITIIQNQMQINKEQFNNIHLIQAYIKRGLACYYSKKYALAYKDFQYVLQKDKTIGKVNYYIGKILVKDSHKNKDQSQKLQQEAILHFEQVVKYHQSEIYVGNALFEIAQLRLKEKDFYEAYYNLKRALDSNFSSKRMQLYKDFTEGVLYLIKRKIKKGVQILSDLLEILVNNKEQKDKKLIDYLKHEVYLYRAYGYVAIEKYELAIEDINKAKKYGKLDLSSIYNKFLGKGILRMDHEDFLMATKYFNKAALKFPANKDPYCLYVISIVRSYSYSMQGMSIDQDDKKRKVLETKEFMNRAIRNCTKVREPSLYFFRGLLNFQLHYFQDALQDFSVAIEEEEEPTASYYLARGRCYACLSILTEAMKDLSIALNLDESLQEAYIYRGKCAYLLGDNNLAFLDFQRLILTDPKNPMVHVYAGNLLMTTGAYQDAIKAFVNADTVKETAIAAFQRARCYCALTDLETAQKEMQSALQLVQNEVLSYIDSECISQLITVSQLSHQDGNKQKILSCIKSITNSIEAFQSGLLKSLTRKDSPLNIQIIPNVKRIKIEKVAVAKDLMNNQSTDKQDFQSLSIDVNQTVDLDSLKDVPMFSYYYENIFQLEDFYLFRGVFYFYSNDYVKAVQDFKMCQQLKYDNEKKEKNIDNEQSMMIYSQSRNSTPMLSMHSSKTDLSDVGLCSQNIHEINYNQLLCYIFLKDKDKIFEHINEIIGHAPKKYQKYFYLLRGLLYEQYQEKDYAQKDLQKFQKIDPKLYQNYIQEGKEITFEPFPMKNRLCNLFAPIQLKIGNKRAVIHTKLSFSMPFIKPPNMIPNIDEESLQEEFNLKQIDAPMPEAPWIRRGQNGIQFTDEMQEEDIDYEDNPINNTQQEHILIKDEQDKNKKSILKENAYSYTTHLNTQKKNLSEQILQQAMVYLVDHEEELSDKHKISLFDESKFEDNTTIDQKKNIQTNKQIKNVLDSSDDDDENGDEVEDEDDSLSEDNVSDEINSNLYLKVGERESMVIMGENMQKKNKKQQQIISYQKNNQQSVDKEKVLSELQSNIHVIEDDIDRESQFRSRQSSMIIK